MKWFVITNSFAAPFFSDSDEQYVEAETAEDALNIVADTYKHPAGLFAAAAYSSHEAKVSGDKPSAMYLCNAEIEKRSLTEGMSGYSYLGISPGVFEIDGVRHEVADPKSGMIV